MPTVYGAGMAGGERIDSGTVARTRRIERLEERIQELEERLKSYDPELWEKLVRMAERKGLK